MTPHIDNIINTINANTGATIMKTNSPKIINNTILMKRFVTSFLIPSAQLLIAETKLTKMLETTPAIIDAPVAIKPKNTSSIMSAKYNKRTNNSPIFNRPLPSFYQRALQKSLYGSRGNRQ